jgi:uncharacterized protein
MTISRLNFLKQAGAISLGFSGLHFLMGTGNGFSTAFQAPGSDGYGPLVKDPNGIFDLPEGFTYQVVSRFGEIMDDGFRLPHVPDGMAAFPGRNGLTVVVRNHEVNSDAPIEEGPFLFDTNGHPDPDIDRSKVYDWGRGMPALGGTTNLVYDTRNQQVVRQFLSLAGTIRNCAGGPTPWNTWITCEETVQKADDHFEADHGFVFEVPASLQPGIHNAQPIKDMGRFNHEAVAVDPESGVIYLTEDRSDGLIYRFIPNRKGDLMKGGTLQAMKVLGLKSMDTRNWEADRTVELNTSLDVAWIDVEDILAPDDDLRYRGFEDGAAKFARGEGMWYGNGVVFFACTNGGYAKKGQIWKYTPSPAEATPDESRNPGKLELFVEPNDATVIENADNLTVSPWGDLIVCEDGDGDQYLVGVTPLGTLYKFGRNALNDSELAGATFSPDGSTLFFNIQKAGLTLAVTGPWKRTE